MRRRDVWLIALGAAIILGLPLGVLVLCCACPMLVADRSPPVVQVQPVEVDPPKPPPVKPREERPRPTRENYNRVRQGMTVDEVQAILGPGRENSRTGGFMTMTFSELFGPSIVVTFETGTVFSKSIFD